MGKKKTLGIGEGASLGREEPSPRRVGREGGVSGGVTQGAMTCRVTRPRQKEPGREEWRRRCKLREWDRAPTAHTRVRDYMWTRLKLRMHRRVLWMTGEVFLAITLVEWAGCFNFWEGRHTFFFIDILSENPTHDKNGNRSKPDIKLCRTKRQACNE